MAKRAADSARTGRCLESSPTLAPFSGEPLGSSLNTWYTLSTVLFPTTSDCTGDGPLSRRYFRHDSAEKNDTSAVPGWNVVTSRHSFRRSSGRSNGRGVGLIASRDVTSDSSRARSPTRAMRCAPSPPFPRRVRSSSFSAVVASSSEVDRGEEEEEEEDAASDVDRGRVPRCRLLRSGEARRTRARRRADGDGDDADVCPPRRRALSDDGDAAEEADDVASDIARDGSSPRDGRVTTGYELRRDVYPFVVLDFFPSAPFERPRRRRLTPDRAVMALRRQGSLMAESSEEPRAARGDGDESDDDGGVDDDDLENALDGDFALRLAEEAHAVKTRKREAKAAFWHDVFVFWTTTMIVVPALVTVFAVAIGAALAAAEGWPWHVGVLYVFSMLCGMPNSLADENPETDAGKVADVVAASWAWGLLGAFIGLVGNLNFVNRLVAAVEGFRVVWNKARSIVHWSPYDPVGVVNADP